MGGNARPRFLFITRGTAMNDHNDVLKNLPSVDELLRSPALAGAAAQHGHESLADAARCSVQAARDKLRAGVSVDTGSDALAAHALALLEDRARPSLQPAINATGILLHTGLGRAVLPETAVAHAHEVIAGYSTLAIEAETGLRGSRDSHVRGLLAELTGAEDGTVVNNNAAATMLILNTLARGREVIVSRGQLVEIGGSFRMPDVMASSGAVMREVGTTNKTHLRDYEAAINECTGAILRVHQSNYRIVGFTDEPSIEELAGLACQYNLPLIDDLGSGALVDLARFGLEREPLVRDSVAAGAEVICFSGDKLIGGPQSGIIVGKSAHIKAIRKNQLMRAFRVGKFTIAALEATLRLFRDPDKLTTTHPFYRMLAQPLEELARRAQAVATRVACIGDVRVEDEAAQVGSGSVPAQSMPTKVLAIRPSSVTATELAKRLRLHRPPVFARISKDAVLLDFRTIQPGEDEIVAKAVAEAMKQ